MAVNVTAAVYIDGARVACLPDALETAPVAVRGFTIDWGREEYQSPDVSPSSVNLYVLDAVGDWARRIREARAIGTKVHIEWTGTTSDGETIGPVVMFRGRVQYAEAKPHSKRLADGRRAWAVTLKCADRTADYGNALAAPETWPRETMIVRAIRVRDLGLAAGSEIAQVYFWPGYVDSNCWPLDVKDKSALELMAELYASMGNDAYAYDPDENVIRQDIRLSQPLTVGLASFDAAWGAVMPVPDDVVVDGKTYPGVGLGGCELAAEPLLAADPSTDINRLECSWKDQGTGFGDWTTIREDVAPGDSRRVMSWTSWLDDGVAIDPTLDNVWARAREEGRRPRHPAITIPPTFSFVNERLARWLLMTWANTRPAYISGSLPYLWLMADEPGYSPIVAPIGGSTSFDPEKGWSATLHVHWIHNSAPAPSPVTWGALEQIKVTSTASVDPWWWPLLGLPPSPPVAVGEPTPSRYIRWGDPADLDGYGWHTSVTWADLRHVSNDRAQVKDILK